MRISTPVAATAESVMVGPEEEAKYLLAVYIQDDFSQATQLLRTGQEPSRRRASCSSPTPRPVRRR